MLEHKSGHHLARPSPGAPVFVCGQTRRNIAAGVYKHTHVTCRNKVHCCQDATHINANMGRRWNFQIGEARGEVKDHDKMADKLLAGYATDNIDD